MLIAAVLLVQLIALLLWVRPGTLSTLWPKRRPPAPESPSWLAPLLEEITQLRHELHDERVARAAALAAERFAAHRAVREAAKTTTPLLVGVTEGDPSGRSKVSIVGAPPRSPPHRVPTIRPPPLRPLAFPEFLIGSEDIPEEVASVIGPGSGLGPHDDTPPRGIRAIRVSKPQ